MIAFLRETRNYMYSGKAMTLVFGNDSCDLDSSITATCLAYFYQMLQEQKDTETLIQFCCKTRYYIPVLNIPRDDYIIKTEVEYVFSKYAITPDILTFRSDIDDETLQRVDIILVDHCISPYLARCVELIQLKPLDENIEIPKRCKVRIGEVGSCATIVAQQVLAVCAENSDMRKVCGFTMLSMLRTAIVFDSQNFSPAPKRFKPEDLEICEKLEAAIELCANREPEARDVLYTTLKEAQYDVDGLTVAQILRKQVTMITHMPSYVTTSVSCVPVRMRHFVQLPDAEEHVQQFAYDNNVSVIILIAKAYDHELTVQRDLGIINVKQTDLYESIVKKLLTLKKPSLELKKIENFEFIDGRFFHQLNTDVSKTFVHPIVNNVLNQWWNEQTDDYKTKHMEALESKMSNKDEIE